MAPRIPPEFPRWGALPSCQRKSASHHVVWLNELEMKRDVLGRVRKGCVVLGSWAGRLLYKQKASI